MLSSVQALSSAGYQVTLAVATADFVHGLACRDLCRRVEVIPELGRETAPTEVVNSFSALVAAERPEAVHLHDFFDPRMISGINATAPVVWSVHNFVGCTSGYKYFRRPGDECTRPHGPGCVPNLLFKGCFHGYDPRPLPGMYAKVSAFLAGLRDVDVAVAHSRFVTRHLESNRVPRVRHVPLFFHGEVTPASLPRFPRALFVGRVTPVKGVEVLIRAAADSDFALDVCGDGWGLARAQRLAAKLKVEGQVRFHRAEPAETISTRYTGASVVAVPSLWPEPFGLVGLEAMAHGRPVVASATGGIPEWLADGETGLLVPPGDPRALARAIGTIIESPSLAADLGRAGADRVRRLFSPNRYLDAMTSTYEAARRHWERGKV